MEIAPRMTVNEYQGHRVPVELVIVQLAGSMTHEEVMKQYDLTKEDILAALDYAAKRKKTP